MSELPWWTEQEQDQAGEEVLREHPELITMRQDIEQARGYTGANINYIYFSRRVLDKYAGHKYVDIDFDDGYGYEYIRFLSLDPSKPPESHVRFLSGISNTRKNFVNMPDDPNILAVRDYDYANIPPRQRTHWKQHEIQVPF